MGITNNHLSIINNHLKMATEAQIYAIAIFALVTCALVAINNRLPREIAKRYLTGAGCTGLNRLYTKYNRLTTNGPSAHYICSVSTTNVVSALQIDPFLTNKANFVKDKMNVNKALTKDYENKTLSGSGKNKANSKPIKANFKKAQMFVTTILTKDYENMSNWAICENKANINPKQSQTKPIPPADLDERSVKRLVDCYNIFIYYAWNCRIIL